MRLKEIKSGMVIHCKTEEEFKTLKEYLISNDYIFETKEIQNDWKGIKYSYGIGLKEYGNATDEISFSDTDFYLRNGYEITEFSDLIIPELSAAEVLKICNEICGNELVCSNCEMAGNCFFERDSDYQKVVEICEQWKANHEKKEPEFEWVDVCRIIEVQDNGFKKCVHEEDLSDHWKELTVEVVLKNYIATHEGNYIAVIEHVCRVKGEK